AKASKSKPVHRIFPGLIAMAAPSPTREDQARWRFKGACPPAVKPAGSQEGIAVIGPGMAKSIIMKSACQKPPLQDAPETSEATVRAASAKPKPDPNAAHSTTTSVLVRHFLMRGTSSSAAKGNGLAISSISGSSR